MFEQISQTKMIYLLLFICLFIYFYCKDSLKKIFRTNKEESINQYNNDNSKFNDYGNGIKKKAKYVQQIIHFSTVRALSFLATTYRTYNFRPRKTLSGFDRSSLKHPAYIVATSLKGRVLTTIS